MAAFDNDHDDDEQEDDDERADNVDRPVIHPANASNQAGLGR
ncbi:MAG: hypothetical protein OSB00_00260 [Sphingomonas bacterium]|nr:hypothetical protein [Sphingomonas bacterium]